MPQKKNRVGEERMMNNGMRAKIITYRNHKDIDIQFENGAIRTNVIYLNFQRGSVRPSRRTMTRTMNNGLAATIVKWRNRYDIDIQFEDGAIVEHVRHQSFIRGQITHPYIKYTYSMSLQEFAIMYYLRDLGFVKIPKGTWKDKGFGGFELDFYHPQKSVAIEYDGEVHNMDNSRERDISKNQKCNELGIKLFRIRHPRCIELNSFNSESYTLDYAKQITSRLFDCKQELEEILARCGILFDVNFINFNRDKDKILVEYNDAYINRDAKQRVGEEIYNHSVQQRMTVIAYRAYDDIDVQFEDGTIKQSVRYNQFQSGELSHPSRWNHIGVKSIHSSGEEMEIIAYRNYRDCDIKFTDGTIAYGKRFDHFQKGHIQKPEINQESE